MAELDENSDVGDKNVENCDPELCIQFLGVPKVANYEGIRTRLNTSTTEWMDVFLDKGGLKVLTENLAKYAGKESENQDANLSLKCVDCIRVVLNKGIGINYALKAENGNLTENILLGVQSSYTKTRMAVTEILSVLAFYNPDGHQSVISALEFYKRERGQRHRFSIIIEELEKTQSSKYKSALLVFVNTLICKIIDAEERCQTRGEFIELGLPDSLVLLSSETNEKCADCTSQKCEACKIIQRHLKIFDDCQKYDNEEEERYDELDASVKSSTEDNGDTKTATKKSNAAIYRELYNCWFVDEIDAASSSLAIEAKAEAGAVFSDGTIIDDIWKRIARG